MRALVLARTLACSRCAKSKRRRHCPRKLIKTSTLRILKLRIYNAVYGRRAAEHCSRRSSGLRKAITTRRSRAFRRIVRFAQRGSLAPYSTPLRPASDRKRKFASAAEEAFATRLPNRDSCRRPRQLHHLDLYEESFQAVPPNDRKGRTRWRWSRRTDSQPSDIRASQKLCVIASMQPSTRSVFSSRRAVLAEALACLRLQSLLRAARSRGRLRCSVDHCEPMMSFTRRGAKNKEGFSGPAAFRTSRYPRTSLKCYALALYSLSKKGEGPMSRNWPT